MSFHANTARIFLLFSHVYETNKINLNNILRNSDFKQTYLDNVLRNSNEISHNQIKEKQERRLGQFQDDMWQFLATFTESYATFKET